jgi:hypothetical protein
MTVYTIYRSKTRRLKAAREMGLLADTPMAQIQNLVLNDGALEPAPLYDPTLVRFDEPLPVYAPADGSEEEEDDEEGDEGTLERRRRSASHGSLRSSGSRGSVAVPGGNESGDRDREMLSESDPLALGGWSRRLSRFSSLLRSSRGARSSLFGSGRAHTQPSSPPESFDQADDVIRDAVAPEMAQIGSSRSNITQIQTLDPIASNASSTPAMIPTMNSNQTNHEGSENILIDIEQLFDSAMRTTTTQTPALTIFTAPNSTQSSFSGVSSSSFPSSCLSVTQTVAPQELMGLPSPIMEEPNEEEEDAGINEASARGREDTLNIAEDKENAETEGTINVTNNSEVDANNAGANIATNIISSEANSVPATFISEESSSSSSSNTAGNRRQRRPSRFGTYIHHTSSASTSFTRGPRLSLPSLPSFTNRYRRASTQTTNSATSANSNSFGSHTATTGGGGGGGGGGGRRRVSSISSNLSQSIQAVLYGSGGSGDVSTSISSFQRNGRRRSSAQTTLGTSTSTSSSRWNLPSRLSSVNALPASLQSFFDPTSLTDNHQSQTQPTNPLNRLTDPSNPNPEEPPITPTTAYARELYNHPHAPSQYDNPKPSIKLIHLPPITTTTNTTATDNNHTNLLPHLKIPNPVDVLLSKFQGPIILAEAQVPLRDYERVARAQRRSELASQRNMRVARRLREEQRRNERRQQRQRELEERVRVVLRDGGVLPSPCPLMSPPLQGIHAQGSHFQFIPQPLQQQQQPGFAGVVMYHPQVMLHQQPQQHFLHSHVEYQNPASFIYMFPPPSTSSTPTPTPAILHQQQQPPFNANFLQPTSILPPPTPAKSTMNSNDNSFNLPRDTNISITACIPDLSDPSDASSSSSLSSSGSSDHEHDDDDDERVNQGFTQHQQAEFDDGNERSVQVVVV